MRLKLIFACRWAARMHPRVYENRDFRVRVPMSPTRENKNQKKFKKIHRAIQPPYLVCVRKLRLPRCCRHRFPHRRLLVIVGDAALPRLVAATSAPPSGIQSLPSLLEAPPSEIWREGRREGRIRRGGRREAARWIRCSVGLGLPRPPPCAAPR